MTVTHCCFPAMHLPLAIGQSHQLIRVLRGAITLSAPGAAPDRFGPEAHVLLPEGSTCAMAMEAGTVAIIVDVAAGPDSARPF